MIRSTVAHVNLAALQANYRALVAHLCAEPGRPAPGVIAVVKANAYGHGATRVALALEEAVNEGPRQYLNRLSDLLFVLGRVLNRAAGGGDVLWQKGRNA